MQDAQQPPPHVQLMKMILGRWVSHAIGTAAKLGLADHLAAGPKTTEDLAKLSSVQPQAVGRLLRALASVGVFTEQEPGRFANTPLSEALRVDSPASARAFALMVDHSANINAWLQLDYSVQTGACGFEKAHGAKPWDWMQKNPEFGRVFDDAMTSFSAQIAPAVAQAYDFSGIGKLIDVGGGHGMLLTTILAKNPEMRGVVFDQPSVVAGAKATIERSGTTSRCEARGGDFFAEVPEGDAYIMKHIIHDWNDTDAQRILQAIHKSAKPGSKLLLIESVIKPGNDPDLAKIVDLEMLVVTAGGRERTEREYAQLLEKSGFRLQRVVPTHSPVCVIEALRV